MTAVATAPRRGRPPAPCGTVAAYHRHRRKGEPVCTACRVAVATGRTALSAALPVRLMSRRPELVSFPSFGATHYAGLVMGA